MAYLRLSDLRETAPVITKNGTTTTVSAVTAASKPLATPTPGSSEELELLKQLIESGAQVGTQYLQTKAGVTPTAAAYPGGEVPVSQGVSWGTVALVGVGVLGTLGVVYMIGRSMAPHRVR